MLVRGAFIAGLLCIGHLSSVEEPIVDSARPFVNLLCRFAAPLVPSRPNTQTQLLPFPSPNFFFSLSSRLTISHLVPLYDPLSTFNLRFSSFLTIHLRPVSILFRHNAFVLVQCLTDFVSLRVTTPYPYT